MNKRIFTYIRRDGYIERITAEDCVLNLNIPPTHKGNVTQQPFEASRIRRYSIWDEYDALGNLVNASLDERRTVANYHLSGIEKHQRVYCGDTQITETTDSFEMQRAWWIDYGCVELECDESDSLFLVVSYARDRIDVPPLLLNIGTMFSEVVEALRD